MPYSAKIVLHAPPPHSHELEGFVEACIRDKVALVCVVGEQSQLVEDIIDELVVGDASDKTRFMTTTSHPDESLTEVIAFASAWSEPEGEPQEVRL
jgi:hypothetical protein